MLPYGYDERTLGNNNIPCCKYVCEWKFLYGCCVSCRGTSSLNIVLKELSQCKGLPNADMKG